MPGLPGPTGKTRRDLFRLSAVRITAAVSPSDPRVCAFALDRPVSDRSVVCRAAAQAAGSPLFEELFKLPGVVQVWADGSRVTVARGEDTDWKTFAGTVGAALRLALKSDRPPVAAGVPANAAGGDLAADIEKVLAEEINPSLAGHGGRAELDGLEGRVARIRFVGGCQGCGAAQLTLAHGVRRTLLDRLPALSDVRDVTDHTAGERPYYPSGAAGASPFPSAK
ncbi:MAG: NifU family protein [Elusimicrobia bacterium]|nr:NifU family protein [Elusimicrobiota bacterium]